MTKTCIFKFFKVNLKLLDQLIFKIKPEKVQLIHKTMNYFSYMNDRRNNGKYVQEIKPN